MEILYFEGSFFRLIRTTHTGYRIRRLRPVIHPRTGREKGGRFRITPMFDVTDGDSFVITKGEREKYEPYDPKRVYTISRFWS